MKETIIAAREKRQYQADVPEDGLLLWTWFWRLSARRQTGMGGPSSLSFNEIETFARMFAIELRQWELIALCAMDDAWKEAQAKSLEKQEDKDFHGNIPATRSNVINFVKALSGGKKRKAKHRA